MSAAILTEDLYKTYPGQPPLQALHPLSLRIQTGEIVVVLGPNGAGKTTLFKILATLVQPTGGEAWLAGLPLRESIAVRRRIGMVSEPDRSFFWRLNARQNLQFFASGYGLRPGDDVRRINELLELLELTELAGKPVGQLSSGQRGRLALARALLHRPPILLLDEPTRSLDPTAATDFLTLLRRYLAETPGASVMLSTHRLGAVAPFCQRVLILRQGRLCADGAPDELLRSNNLPVTDSAADNLAQIYEALVGREAVHAH
ncbi:MAG TPA: ABC transporter ATP-binding protein [Caldilineae bacterium]|nr:ABC transporter ATP-binding protein [Caldilineae bacterium]